MAPLNILVVDDDRFHADSLVELFEIDGHRAAAAYDAETALAIFSERAFDLTFLDIRLPGMNGLECCMEIRRLAPDARVVMMTGNSFEQVVAEVAGATSTVALRPQFESPELLNGLDVVGAGGVVFINRDGARSAENIRDRLAAADREAIVVTDPDRAMSGELTDMSAIPVLDFRLPFTDALGVCMWIRKHGCARPMVLIAVMTDGPGDNMIHPESRSRTGFLFKPLSLPGVLQLVSGLSQAGD